MNIAIIAPSSVPFVMGGAENLWLGLQRHINEQTKHHCELFKLPTKEGSLIELVRSYRQYAQFDATSFDKIVTGKYPSWMTEHPSHIVYMLHTLRGVYDTYHFCNEPTHFDFPGVFSRFRLSMDRLMADRGASNQQVIDFLIDLEALILELGEHAHELRFPGPFSRSVIHFLDGFALRPERIAKYAAISRTVRNRPEYFPKGVLVDIIYPPPRLDGYKSRRDDFLFTTSRLDGPKRIGLLIEAMHYVKTDIKLLIGGKGPEESRLKELAADDARIVFLGQLTDQELIDYYADALAVPFVPFEEDYGLVTIEAMKSAKPIITTTDSGGVLEFVNNLETGLVVPPYPESIAQAIDFMCSHRGKAQAMGRAAKEVVKNISWSSLAARLLGIETQRRMNAAPMAVTAHPFKTDGRQKMVVAVTFPIFPPRGGGQSRIFHLYRELSKIFDITIVSLAGATEPAFNDEIAPGLREIRVPKSIEHERIESEYSGTVDWVPVTDIVASVSIGESPQYLDELKKACEGASIVVVSHPFLIDALLKYSGDAEIWFESHNVEYSLKEGILPNSEAAKKLLDIVRNCEGKSWKTAKVVFACAGEDIEKLNLIYGPSDAAKLVVPNGFSPDEVTYVDLDARRTIKAKLGLEGRPTVIFMGSWHGPNLEAVEWIFGFADAMPSVVFLIVGSAGMKFLSARLPENVKILGVVNEKEKRLILSSADLAINPMKSGSGSNLKMLEYFAAGLPVLSTRFGARGIDVEAGLHYLSAEIDDFVSTMSAFFIQPDDRLVRKMCVAAAELVQNKYSWHSVAEEAIRTIIALRPDRS